MFDIVVRSLVEAVKILSYLTVLVFRIVRHLWTNPAARAATLWGLLVVVIVAALAAVVSGVGRAGAWLANGLVAGAPEAIAVLVLLLAAAVALVALLARRNPAVRARYVAWRARRAGLAAGPATSNAVAPPSGGAANQIEWVDGATPWAVASPWSAATGTPSSSAPASASGSTLVDEIEISE